MSESDLWASIRQRDANINEFFKALKREEKYLLEHFDADCGIMPGDVEGSFHRLREVFYRTVPQEPTNAFKVVGEHFGMKLIK